MKRVYLALVMNDYKNLPNEILSRECIMPHPEYKLSINDNDKRKTVFYNGGCKDNENIKRTILRFETITDTILKILNSKEEYKNLPEEHRLAL